MRQITDLDELIEGFHLYCMAEGKRPKTIRLRTILSPMASTPLELCWHNSDLFGLVGQRGSAPVTTICLRSAYIHQSELTPKAAQCLVLLIR